MSEHIIGYACTVIMLKMGMERPSIFSVLSIQAANGGEDWALQRATEHARSLHPDHEVYGGGIIPIRLQWPPQATGGANG